MKKTDFQGQEDLVMPAFGLGTDRFTIIAVGAWMPVEMFEPLIILLAFKKKKNQRYNNTKGLNSAWEFLSPR